jgi:hypothetical protein
VCFRLPIHFVAYTSSYHIKAIERATIEAADFDEMKNEKREKKKEKKRESHTAAC